MAESSQGGSISLKPNEFDDYDDNKTPHYRVLVFDLDCLLEDSRSLRVRSLAAALVQLGSEEQIQLEIPDDTSLELLSSAIEANLDLLAPGLDKGGLARLLELVQENKVEAVHQRRLRLAPDIPEAIKELKDMGYLLAIQTPDDRDYMLAVVDYFELDRYIDISICSSDVGREQPELRLLEIMEKEELLSSEAMLVSNRGTELEVARAMGITTIGCLWGGGDDDELQLADHLVESAADLVRLLSGANQ